MKEKFIEALKSVQNPTVNSSYDLQTWKAKAINIISRIYGDDSKQEEQIKEIKYQSYLSFGTIGGRNTPSTRSGGGNNGKKCEKQAQELIESFIYDLETFDIPEPKQTEKSGGINISLHQNQNQTVNVNVIWESIRDELKGSQLKEIEEIINDNDEPQSKKKRIFDKVKSFGTDVATNIIAGILTNPAIYGG
ncbi:hypothetical protein KN811_21635 [Sinomicrobium sp. 2019215]|nr:hypothetical protein [Sinomicrobium weinanense]MBU3126024.1 hypothetical protein [Sinomicrobium weinanense]